jgi:hypothetical protein
VLRPFVRLPQPQARDPRSLSSWPRPIVQLDRLLASIDAAANAKGMLLDLQLNERAYVVRSGCSGLGSPSET